MLRPELLNQSRLCTICDNRRAMITFILYHLSDFLGYQTDSVRFIKDMYFFRYVVYQRTTQCSWIVSKTEVKTNTQLVSRILQQLIFIKVFDSHVVVDQSFSNSPLTITDDSCTSWVRVIQILITFDIDFIQPLVASISSSHR